MTLSPDGVRCTLTFDWEYLTNYGLQSPWTKTIQHSVPNSPDTDITFYILHLTPTLMYSLQEHANIQTACLFLRYLLLLSSGQRNPT